MNEPASSHSLRILNCVPIDIGTQLLHKLCAISFFVFLGCAICQYQLIYLLGTIRYRITKFLTFQVFQSVLEQEVGFYENQSPTELLEGLYSDVKVLADGLSGNIIKGVVALIIIVCGTILMIAKSITLALITFVPLISLGVFMHFFGKSIRINSMKVQNAWADNTREAKQRLVNYKAIKLYSRENKEIETYNESIKIGPTFKLVHAQALYFIITKFTGTIVFILVLYFVDITQMTFHNEINVGELITFLLFAAYIGILIECVFDSYYQLREATDAAIRIWTLLNRFLRLPFCGGIVVRKEDFKPSVIFLNVYFAYPELPRDDVLSSIDLIIEPKQIVAIVGVSGSGKTTLVSLLLGLYRPRRGAVFVSDVDIRTMNRPWLSKQIGYANLDDSLYPCSIKDNIFWGTPESTSITELEFMRAAELSKVSEFIPRLRQRFDTIIGKNGTPLSVGEKQRVLLARAIIANPTILIIEESNSYLDSQSDKIVKDALKDVMKNRTVLVIAHRVSTIRQSDYVVIMQNGRIVETGRYDYLWRREGPFKELISRQIFQS